MQITTIQSKIYEIRGVKVMLDFDLAHEGRGLQIRGRRAKDMITDSWTRISNTEY